MAVTKTMEEKPMAREETVAMETVPEMAMPVAENERPVGEVKVMGGTEHSPVPMQKRPMKIYAMTVAEGFMVPMDPEPAVA